MIQDEWVQLARELSAADGVAGREHEVREVLRNYLAGTSLMKSEDNFGNFYARTGDGQGKKKVMLMAHTDEVGFLVRHITEDGFLYLQPLGGWWSHVLLAQLVTVSARKNNKKYRGVIGTTPKKNADAGKTIPLDEIYVDLGVASKAEVEALGILPGDMVTPFTQPEVLNHASYLLGKAWDDRIQCTVMAAVMKEVATKKWQHIEVIGVGSSQEEVGTRGSKIATEQVRPDIGLVLDVATAKDTPYADRYQNRVLGKGPGIVWYDKTALADVNLADKMLEVAEQNEIPVQHDMLAGGGTDAGSVHLTGAGVPTLALSLGVRYCHSGASIVHMEDVGHLVQLIVAFLEDLEHGKGEL